MLVRRESISCPEAVQANVLGASGSMEQFAPQMGPAHVDTLKDQSTAKLKELRVTRVTVPGESLSV